MGIGMNFSHATNEAVENFLSKWKKYTEKYPTVCNHAKRPKNKHTFIALSLSLFFNLQRRTIYSINNINNIVYKV
jgi:hypothetical protein